jgi:hypothetical protein
LNLCDRRTIGGRHAGDRDFGSIKTGVVEMAEGGIEIDTGTSELCAKSGIASRLLRSTVPKRATRSPII